MNLSRLLLIGMLLAASLAVSACPPGPAGVWCVAPLLDNQDAAHLMYSLSGGPLYYATNMTGGWSATVVDDIGTGSVFIALDGRDLVHAVYTNCGTLWRLVFPRGYTATR